MPRTGDVMKFSCTDPECPGEEICRKRAIEKITELIEEAAYGRKVVHPCLSRWWKLSPCARIILFGVAFFRLWRNAAPIKKKGMPAIEPVQIDGINIDMGDDWHAMHNWRVGATSDFLTRPTLCSTLILTLQSLQCGHQIMGWIMKHLGFHRNASIDGGDDDAEPDANAGPVHAKDRRHALLEFTNPKTSVVHRALRDGASLFQDEKKWAAYLAYSTLSPAQSYLKLWAMVLPVLAIMDARVLGFIKSWTLKIFRILSEDPAEQKRTWNEFGGAPECCTPRGLRNLKLAKSFTEMVAVVSEIIKQADLGNHDQEVNHARMRHRLEVSQVKDFGFANEAFGSRNWYSALCSDKEK